MVSNISSVFLLTHAIPKLRQPHATMTGPFGDRYACNDSIHAMPAAAIIHICVGQYIQVVRLR